MSRPAAATEVWRARLALALLAVLTILLRLQPVVLVPSLDFADEIFQATEQAHRLVYGTGIVPWEFQLGARSWLLPGAIAGVMWAARLIGEGPVLYLPAIAVSMGVLALVPVACCFGWARKQCGLAGAIVAGIAVAVAPELVYFGARSLSEVVAGHLMVGGAYLLQPGAARRRLVGAGCLLGLVLALRVQLAPAVALLGLWPGPAGWRMRLPWLAGGGLAVLFAAGVLDWMTLGYPFASLWRYVVFNGFDGVSASFGVEPWSFYLRGEAVLWGAGLVPLLGLALLGGRQQPALLAAALVILAVHCAVPHKEYRFIYPAVLLVAVLAGLGLAQVAAWLAASLHLRGMAQVTAGLMGALVVILAWCALSWQVWAGPTLVSLRHRAHDDLLAARFVSGMRGICGVGLYDGDVEGWVYGGYTFFHQPVPIYWPATAAALVAAVPGFDVLVSIVPRTVAPGFLPVRCFGVACVSRRPGVCRPMPEDVMPFPAMLEHLRPHAPRAIP
jgi:hypothetical protein